MALTAHKTVAMFMRYVHAEDDQVRAAAETVAQKRQDLVTDPSRVEPARPSQPTFAASRPSPVTAKASADRGDNSERPDRLASELSPANQVGGSRRRIQSHGAGRSPQHRPL